MKENLALALKIIGAGIVLTIIFIKSGQNGNDSGAKQASDIINSTSGGVATIIRASTGE